VEEAAAASGPAPVHAREEGCHVLLEIDRKLHHRDEDSFGTTASAADTGSKYWAASSFTPRPALSLSPRGAGGCPLGLLD
jgi:hypothetical protein